MFFFALYAMKSVVVRKMWWRLVRENYSIYIYMHLLGCSTMQFTPCHIKWCNLLSIRWIAKHGFIANLPDLVLLVSLINVFCWRGQQPAPQQQEEEATTATATASTTTAAATTTTSTATATATTSTITTDADRLPASLIVLLSCLLKFTRSRSSLGSFEKK